MAHACPAASSRSAALSTLIDLLYRYGEADDRIFCSFVTNGTETAISFAGLIAGAQAYARRYRDQGLHEGDVVFIVLRHRPDLLYAFAGALIAGCVPSFLAPLTEKQDPALYWPTLAALFRRTEAAGLVVGKADLAEMAAAGLCINLSVFIAEDGPQPPVCAQGPAVSGRTAGDRADLAFLQFSSGTTGLRKGVMLTHGMVIEQITAYRNAVGLGPDSVIVSWLPLYHDMGLIACLAMPMALGCRLILLDPFEWVRDPALLFHWIQREHATHCWLPNFAFNHLAATIDDGANFDLSSVKAFVNCSEPCKPATFDRFLARFQDCGVQAGHLQTCYAMAEAVFAVTQSLPGQPVRRLLADAKGLAENLVRPAVADAPAVELLSTGRLLPGLRLRVLDPEGHPLPDRHVGEIVLAGSFLFESYYRSAEETARAFRDGWYLTGDLGFTDGGELFVTGRRKDVIIINGRNYYCHDIEALVGSLDGLKAGRLVAVGAESPETGSEELVILAETAEEDRAVRQARAKAVRNALLRNLNLAARVELVPPGWLIKTTSGKINRRANLDRYLELRRSRKGPVS